MGRHLSVINPTLVSDIGIQGRSGESVRKEKKESLKGSNLSRLAGDDNVEEEHVATWRLA
jgi:hypothetical protein